MQPVQLVFSWANKGDFCLIGPLEITLTHALYHPFPSRWLLGKNRIADRFSSLTKRIDRLFFFLLFLDANFLLAAAFLMAGNGGVYFLQASRKLFFNMRRACKRLLSHVGEKTANLAKCPGVA